MSALPTTGSPAAATARATRRDWVGLAVIALPCMLYSMDVTVLNLAVPELARELHPSAGELLWIIDVYGFMVAGCLMLMGSLGDRFGRRRLLLIGAAAFGAVSMYAAFSDTATELIVARALLGIAGATLAPSTLSLISSMFRDESERTFAISMWIMSFSVGAVVGPVAGGVLIERFGWGAVFLAGVPVMALLLVLGPFLLPEYRDPDAAPIDIPSAVVSSAAVLSLVWALKHAAEHGLSPAALASALAGLGLALAFARRQRRLEHPYVDLRLFRSPAFALALTVNALALFFMFGTFILFAQYLQLVVGLSPLEAGLWSMPGAVAFAAASPFVARLAERVSPLRALQSGLLVSAAGFALLAMGEGLLVIVAGNIVMSLGLTPVFALTTGFVVAAAPLEKVGMASALSETASELGGAVGVAVIGSVLTVVYRARMSGVDVGALPPGLGEAARATLAGAVQAAERLGDAPGTALLARAHAGFMEAFHLAALFGGVTLAALALLSGRVLAPPSGTGTSR